MSCNPLRLLHHRSSRKTLAKSIEEYHDTRNLASMANISFKNDRPGRRFVADEVKKFGKGSISAQPFHFRDLCLATHNFHEENMIGEGGFGRVYRGRISGTDKDVAVKQLDKNGFQGNREFVVEVLLLGLLHHQHLVKLIGYCAEKNQRILVYEFMPNGSLEDHLFDLSESSKPLDWNTRIKIAEGAAKGLEYLHEVANPPVIYRDFKASNVLLDEHMNPKVSDFGLAKLGPTGDKSHVSTRVMGTYGYCAPEYAQTGKLTAKSDVYSFGVVLLEIIAGRRVLDLKRRTEEQNLIRWVKPMWKDKSRLPEMADRLLKGCYPTRGLCQAVEVAAMCLHEDATARPKMGDVVTALEFLAKMSDKRT